MTKKLLTFVEMDLDYCSLRYGQGACPAVLGEDSDHKCFNTSATCAVREAFTNAPVTLRFAKGTAYLAESGIEAIAALENESFTPPTVSLGENLGTRASLSVTFSDFKWPDTGIGFDKYVRERDYDPFEQGTFWGKFRVRHPFLRGRPIRLIRGELGQAIEDMETRHFVMESFEGPSLDGRFTIVAKDALKLADDERAQAPRPSNGYLAANITAAAISLTLLPSGIGDLEYPASGKVNIGGKEICSFTRVGDVLTLVRAQNNGVAVAHRAQDRVQLCLEYLAQNAANIMADLLVTYANVPADYVPLEEWLEETTAYLGVLYTRLIPEPTGVNKLASELVQQAALSVWWDDLKRRMRLRVLRPILTDAALFHDENVVARSMRIRDQHDKRLSQVWVYYGLINPLDRVDEPRNYRSFHISGDLLLQAEYLQPAVKKIYGAFIPEFGRQVAQRAGNIILGQFRYPPRLATFQTFRGVDPKPELGMACNIMSRPIQTDTGAPALMPAQITRITPQESGYLVEAPELRFVSDEIDLGDRSIIIGSSLNNFNWRQAYDRLYPAPTLDDEIICFINEGATVGSASTGLYAFDVGIWPEGTKLILRVRGRIQGPGGNAGRGGSAGSSGRPGANGGIGLYTRQVIDLDLASMGQLWGGAGGGGGGAGGRESTIGGADDGGGGGGGGGAGTRAGDGGSGIDGGRGGDAGTDTSGGGAGAGRGDSGAGGRGGDPGQNGSRGEGTRSGSGGSGGSAGAAIDGDSFVTITGTGDIRGPRRN